MFCSAIIESSECYTPKFWHYIDIKRPYSIIYYIIDGTAFYKINDKTYQFKKGHLYLMPSNTVYSLFEDPKDKLYHAYVHAFIHPAIKRIIELDVSKDSFLEMVIKHLREYIVSDTPQTPNIYTLKLTEMLVSYISEIEQRKDDSMHSKIKQYLDDNYIEIFKNNNLAAVFNYSNSQINKIFKDAYNITPKKYCINLILKHMLNLLRSGYSSKDVANMFDFSSPASFSRFFKNNYGFCPKDITAKHN